MKSYKCSKADVLRALAKVLRDAPEKIQRKKYKEGEKAKREAVATMRKI